MPVSNSLLKPIACLGFLICGPVLATDISVVGVFPGKAVLVVDNAAPKTYAEGAIISEGIKLVAADAAGATLDVNGKRQTIALGQHHNAATLASSANARVILRADSRGHFYADGLVNGVGTRFMVDTGATSIALPAAEAQRMGIDYRKGTPGYANTANGIVPMYRVKLNSVKIGDIELNQVEATVSDGNGLSGALLGMSFLNRTTMQRDGDTMTLTKRY